MLCCVFAILYRISTGESIITTHTTCVCVFHFVQLEQQCSCSAFVSNCCFVYLYLPLPFFFFWQVVAYDGYTLTHQYIDSRTLHDIRYTIYSSNSSIRARVCECLGFIFMWRNHRMLNMSVVDWKIHDLRQQQIVPDCLWYGITYFEYLVLLLEVPSNFSR